MSGLGKRFKADLCILFLSGIWGCTFVITKSALADISPLLFISIRFTIAAAVLFPLLPGTARRGGFTRGALAGGGVMGLLLFIGFGFQTVGLLYTTPARSAFITAMYVVFTPLLALLLGLRRPSLGSAMGVVLATIGLHLLTNPGTVGFGKGELFTTVGALAFAAHLLAVDHYTRRHDPRVLAFLQVAVVAVLAIGPTLLLEERRFTLTPGLIFALAVTSLLATAVAIYVLNVVQAWTSPTRAAIIFSAEPVFAAMTSWAVEGEVLQGLALLGAFLILAGMLTAELFGGRPGSPGSSAAPHEVRMRGLRNRLSTLLGPLRRWPGR